MDTTLTRSAAGVPARGEKMNSDRIKTYMARVEDLTLMIFQLSSERNSLYRKIAELVNEQEEAKRESELDE